MEIKYNKSFKNYKYLIMFDLASKISGVCVWDIAKKCPCRTTILNTAIEATELPVATLYNLLDNFFNELYKEKNVKNTEILVYKEAMPVQLRGGSSTVKTFVSLARSHAILDLYVFSHNIATYDYVGIYPATTHAYYKKLNQLPAKEKVTKDQVKEYVEKRFSIKCSYADESDAVFLALTFVESKWNNDLKEAQSEYKKHIKTLKLDNAKNAIQQKIEMLELLKI